MSVLFHPEHRSFVLTGVRKLDPATNTDKTCDVTVTNGTVTDGISEGLPVLKGDTYWLTPPLTDIHVHLREPGQEWKEDIATASAAAAAGGVGRIVGMANTAPTIDQPSLLQNVIQRGKNVGLVDVQSVGACTLGLQQQELAPLASLAESGAVAFSDDGMVIQNAQMMRRILEYSRTLQRPIVVHAEDKNVRQDGTMHEGKTSWALGQRGNPRVAEAIMVARDIELARATGGHVHIQHVSTADAVRLIARAKDDGLSVTAEVCPHHLLLVDSAIETHGTAAKMAPPLREIEDNQALWQGLLDGTIDCLATDHAPHAVHEKERPFDEAPFGILGLQTLLPLTLQLALSKNVPPLQWLSWLVTKPAQVMGMPTHSLSNQSATWQIINPEQEWQFNAETNCSKSQNSPWFGETLRGQSLMLANAGRTSCIEASFATLIDSLPQD